MPRAPAAAAPDFGMFVFNRFLFFPLARSCSRLVSVFFEEITVVFNFTSVREPANSVRPRGLKDAKFQLAEKGTLPP